MKTISSIILCLCGLISFSQLHAQDRTFRQPVPDRSKYTNEEKPVPTDITKRKDLKVMNGSWTNYNREDLSRMPVKDLNKVVNSTPGVTSSGDEAPRIRGAEASGTAYYVDGVRIYGALPAGLK